LVSVVKFIAERGLAFRDDENVGSSRTFFQKNFQNFFQVKFQEIEDAMLLVRPITKGAQHFCPPWKNMLDMV